MIDWQILVKEDDTYFEDGWFFKSFEIQEYLLPIINVGFSFIDEYNDTKFESEDCNRLIGNINFLLDSALLSNRASIKLQTLNKGVVDLKTNEIVDALVKLKSAANKALEKKSPLVFYGD